MEAIHGWTLKFFGLNCNQNATGKNSTKHFQLRIKHYQYTNCMYESFYVFKMV